MKRDTLDQRLSKISTLWSILRQAHEGPPDAATAARQLILQRYGGAVHRYLLSAVRDPHLADDLLQEFGLALVRGDLHRADPSRGRFRDYIKTILFHLVSKHAKKRQRQPQPLPEDSTPLASLAAPTDDDEQFDRGWRDQVLARTWEALADVSADFHAVLRFRAENPDMASPDLARRLGPMLGRPLTADGVRQTLRRARDRFADLLLEEVARSLEQPTAEQVADELAALDLLEYCRPALERYQRPAP
jgi:RNA polymerase sigma-70 factor (ECF subfamily)